MSTVANRPERSEPTNVYFSLVIAGSTEYFVNGAAQLLRWAVNNISSVHAGEPIIGRAVETARTLGWPKPIPDTVELPATPPVVWDYTTPVASPGGPGRGLGRLAEAIISIEKGQVFEFVLQNTRALNGVAEYHPWHAHGYSFWVVGQGKGVYNAATDVATYNLKNPVLRDTVSLQPLGWVAIRFLADNPGTWLFHCHILSHQIMGMGFVVVVQPDQIMGDIPPSVEFCDNHQLFPFPTPVKAPVKAPTVPSVPVAAVPAAAPAAAPAAVPEKQKCGLFKLNILCLNGCGVVGRLLKLCKS